MDEEQQREREELVSRMFALITMKLEDGAAIAAECQGRRPVEELRDGVGKLQSLASETATIIEGAAALTLFKHAPVQSARCLSALMQTWLSR